MNGPFRSEPALSSELADELDPLSLRILLLELTTPNLSNKEIIERLGIKANRKTIDARRRNPVYQNRYQLAFSDYFERTRAASLYFMA